MARFSDFDGKEWALFNLQGNPKLIHNIDSFYAQQKNISPYCLYIKYNYKSLYYQKKACLDSALVYNDSSLKILTLNKLDKKYIDEYISSLNFRGELLYDRGNYNESYNSYFAAKQLSEQLKDTCLLSQYSYHLAMISYKQKKYAAAIDYFRQSIADQKDCGDSNGSSQEVLDNIALCFEKRHMPDSALYYYDSAITRIRIHKEHPEAMFTDIQLAVIYGNIGSLYLSMGNVDSAIGMLTKSYDTNIQMHYDNGDALLTHLKLVKAYLQKNEPDMAMRSMSSLRGEMDTIWHELDAECTWRQLMYEYYEKTGNNTEGYKYLKEYIAIRDSLWAVERKQLQADATTELGKKQEAYLMGQLQKQNRESGTYLWVTVIFLVMALVIVVLVYINYRRGKKNIKMLTALKTELEETDKEKDKIMDIVVHDLRGPVSGIYTVADMMLAEGGKSEEDKEWIGMIIGASESALALINQLMGYKNEAREAFVKDPNDIMKLADDTIKLLQLRASEKRITLHKHLASSPVIIQVDKEKINRVLSNLIVNAIKFSNPDSTIDITVTAKETVVLITIKDYGIGIPKVLQNEVFGMFTAARRSGTAGEKTFGLGLSITKHIVEAHDGKIWLESEEGKGTTFFVELPR